ncbi:MAG: hypothetical protein U0165_19435 [Polyangiaceae bacterium]
MVGRLSPDMRDKTIDLMIAAVVRQDPVGVADALYAIGSPTRKVDMRAYRAEVSMLAGEVIWSAAQRDRGLEDAARHHPRRTEVRHRDPLPTLFSLAKR